MALVCSQLSFRYPRAASDVLADVSFAVSRGELVGVAGASGCGKTTLLRLLAGLERPCAGTVTLDGEPLDGTVPRRIGLVQQLPERQLFAATAYDDVAFGPRTIGCSDEEVAERVEQALASVGLDIERARTTSPFAFSGGEQRRACIAGTLAMRPDYVLLDEPTAGLDPAQRDALMGLLAQRGVGVVVVSHDLDVLAEHVGRLVIIGDGGVRADGATADVACDGRLLACAGLEQPLAARMARRLRARGVALADGTATADALVEALAACGRAGERA